MSKFYVEKSEPLRGEVEVSGAKNSALPIIAACILAGDICKLSNIPYVSDINAMLEILELLGCNVCIGKGGKLTVNSSHIKQTVAPYSYVSKLRASFLVTGPLLATSGKATVSFPGGCQIGSRPVDLHLKGFEALGAKVSQSHGTVTVKAKKLVGSKIYLDYPSVGATENIMMAACLAEGTSYIENAATEPEISDLAKFLRKMGAKISGDGTETIEIKGVENLHGASHTVIPDRIEAGTYLAAAAITGGDVTVLGINPEHMIPITAKLCEMGGEITADTGKIRVNVSQRLRASDISTMPHPGFPTDMQAQFSALLSICDGTSIIRETVFENRFLHVNGLKRMGANIRTEGRSAVIEGTKRLTGAPVEATDLRAGAALVLAGLAAAGTTEISEIEHIDRGYFKIDEKLGSLGAKITRE